MPPTSADVARVTRSKSQARRYYDRLSSIYDLLAGWSEAEARRKGMQLLSVQPGEAVLEIGPGTGSSLVGISRAAGEQGLVCGLDLSPGMLARAQRRLKTQAGSPDCRLVCGDGAFLPLPAGRFDAVFLAFTLELFDTPEIPQVLGECSRVLRPGGRISVVSLSLERPSLASRVYARLHNWLPQAADCRPIYASRSLTQAGFVPLTTAQMSLWGLWLELVCAQIDVESGRTGSLILENQTN